MNGKLYLTIVLLTCVSLSAISQIMPVNREPYGGNKRAWVGEQIGVVKVDISYNRPGVKGREGKVWGTNVAHYGFIDYGHGTSYSAPWRAGANENTTITFTHPVKIEGKDLPAGKYGFYIANGEEESTLIFSKVNNSWGSFYYDEKEDALRVTVKNVKLDESVEWLRYDFINQTDNSATIALSWEKRMIPFKVEADTKKLQIEEFKKDFRTTRNYYDFLVAVYWCVDNDYELEQALAWADRAISFRVMGEKNFRSVLAKAAVLNKMGKGDEAIRIMEEVLPMGSVGDVHYYGRTLLQAGQKEAALSVFKANYDKHPNDLTTNVGLGRGYSAVGDYKKALKYMKAALPLAKDDVNKNNVQDMIKKLEEGKDVN